MSVFCWARTESILNPVERHSSSSGRAEGDDDDDENRD